MRPLTDRAIHDAGQVAVYFNYTNRIADTAGTAHVQIGLVRQILFVGAFFGYSPD